MKILKRYLHIWTALIAVFAVNLAFASSEGSHQEQDGRRKADQSMIRPDGEVNSQLNQDEQDVSTDSVIPQGGNLKSNSLNSEKSDAKVDSVEDDSVSKYNFIFYFLYKFKYDSEESP